METHSLGEGTHPSVIKANDVAYPYKFDHDLGEKYCRSLWSVLRTELGARFEFPAASGALFIEA